MSVLEKLKTRGYWEIVIRPTRFTHNRVLNIVDLREIVRAKRVELRGWGFPHYGHQDPQVAVAHIEQQVDFLRHVEAWRFYQSGLFVYLGGLRADWEEQNLPSGGSLLPRITPGCVLGIADTIWILTEAFEFAARLALSEAGSDRMHVSAAVHGLRGRALHMEIQSRYISPRPPLDGLDAFPQSGDFAPEQLVAESKSLALAWARDLFRRFGWDAPLAILAEIQSQIVCK